MNDKILLEDILTTIKAQCDLYLHATIESSTPDVHDTFNNSLFEFLNSKWSIYQNGRKKLVSKEQVPMNKVQQVEQKFVNQVQ